MLIALHIDPKDWSKLFGIWLVYDSNPNEIVHFYPDHGHGFAVGAGFMELKGSGVSWWDWLRSMDSLLPYSAYWAILEESNDYEVENLYHQLRREVYANAHEMTKSVTSFGSIAVPGVTSQMKPEHLSEKIQGPTTPFITNTALSSKCKFFADSSQMVVVVLSGSDESISDLALAWGLAYRGDRALSLVMPTGTESGTQIRLPWLQPRVRLFSYDVDVIRESIPLSEEESLNRCKESNWVNPSLHSLGASSELVASLLRWLSTASDIKVSDRKTYCAWHVLGRQVLKITKSKTGLNITAGVDAKNVKANRRPVKFKICENLTSSQYFEIVEAVSQAALDRLLKSDDGHAEHHLQSILCPEDFSLAGWRKEVAVRRVSLKLGFVDFLGWDSKGRLHVVETKIGSDSMLVLQGLDYWLWCTANKKELNNWLEINSAKLPCIRFIVQIDEVGENAISIYTAAQLEALHRDINWRFSTVIIREDQPLEIAHMILKTVPEPHQRAGGVMPRWRYRFLSSASAAATLSGSKMAGAHQFKYPSEMLLPEAQSIYEELGAMGLTHKASLSVNSSQTFALNLLAPLSKSAWTEIAKYHLQDPLVRVVDDVVFEFIDEKDLLCESSKRSSHRTQVDCLVSVVRGDGRKHLILIEVKLTEDSFGTCSAFDSPKNIYKAVCLTALPFGGRPSECFQLLNHSNGQRRKYDTALGEIDQKESGFGCWFRDDGNQIMRNVALAKSLVSRGDAASASMILMAPDAHRYIWDRWRTHTSRLSGVRDFFFGELQASNVVALHDKVEQDRLIDQYVIDRTLIQARLAQKKLDQLFPDGVVRKRINVDGSTRYVDYFTRLVVSGVTDVGVEFDVPYPAGPTKEFLTQSEFDVIEAPVHIALSDGGMTLSDPNGNLKSQELKILKLETELQIKTSPWWVAVQLN